MEYLLGIAGDLSVQVQDHALLLHSLEHGVVDVVALNARLAVGGDTTGVGLDTY